MAVHQMDLLRCVLGAEAREVVCRPSNPSWSQFDEPPAASALISFAGGVVASYRGSWIAHEGPTTWAGSWTIECEKGAIQWQSRADSGSGGEKVTVQKEGGKAAREIALPKLRYADRSGTLDALVTAIRTGRTPETTAAENVSTLKLVYGTISAAETGKIVRLV
jgi:predicted dehydrogenase